MRAIGADDHVLQLMSNWRYVEGSKFALLVKSDVEAVAVVES